jgi:hypothetical protein
MDQSFIIYVCAALGGGLAIWAFARAVKKYQRRRRRRADRGERINVLGK